MLHSPPDAPKAPDPFRTQQAFLMHQAGTLRSPDGTRHTFQLIVSGAADHGRFCPVDYTVQSLPSRWRMRLERTLRHPTLVPNGWHGRFDILRGNETSPFRLAQQALFCDAERQRLPGGGPLRSMRITDVFDLIPGRGTRVRGVPAEVGAARVALRADGGWTAAAARSMGKILKLGSVGTFAPEAKGPFLLHAVLAKSGVSDAGQLPYATPRRLFLDAHGCEMDQANENGVPAGKATVALPQGLTVSFLVPSGSGSLTEMALRRMPAPFVSLRREGSEVQARFGSGEAYQAAREGRLQPLFGTDDCTRVADLSLSKNGSVTDEHPTFDASGAEIPAVAGISHANGNARPAIGAALHGVDWLTVRKGHSASLADAVRLAVTLGYDELVVESCRPYRFDFDNGNIAQASHRPYDNVDPASLPGHRWRL